MFIIDKMNQYSILYPEVKPLFYDILRIITIQTLLRCYLVLIILQYHF